MANDNKLDTTAYRKRLKETRIELLKMGSASKESRRPVTLDQQSVGRLSRMDALQSQAMALASEERRQRQVHRIDAALQRIEEDLFGYCAACGESIAMARLENDPTTPNCVKCARAAER